MTARNLSALKAPIMGRVVCLCVEIDAQVLLLPKRLQHTHGQDLLNTTRILFKHAAAFNIQREMMRKVLASHLRKYVYFETRKGQIVCQLKNRYKKTNISKFEIYEINNIIKQTDYGSNYYRSQKRLPKTTKARR